MPTENNAAAIEKIQKKVDELSAELASLSKNVEKKLDDSAKSLKGLDKSIGEVKDSKESAVIIKKIDDILVSLSDSDVVPKKLDDLQSYIAEFSGIEEKVQDLSSQFEETKEIVKSESAASSEPKKPAKKPKETKETKTEKPEVKVPDKTSLPSTIDALMDNLMTLVIPQTEATEMAEALEEVRDELTTMIKGHTPVLFQFGKRARELKSYPPTATLNENDIASLSREIKAWKSKLKELASSS